MAIINNDGNYLKITNVMLRLDSTPIHIEYNIYKNIDVRRNTTEYDKPVFGYLDLDENFIFNIIKDFTIEPITYTEIIDPIDIEIIDTNDPIDPEITTTTTTKTPFIPVEYTKVKDTLISSAYLTLKENGFSDWSDI